MIISKKKFIGILGGTFDPAHSGHILISYLALTKLGLEEIWWIISKKNPLKKNISSYEERLERAKKIVRGNKIRIIEIDDLEKTIYSVDLVDYLHRKFPKKKFIWLVGIDNLKKFHTWKDWKKIFCNIPIAIFDRPSYSLNVVQSKALSFFRNRRIKSLSVKRFKYMKPPSWVFVTGVTSTESSTNLRLKNEPKF